MTTKDKLSLGFSGVLVLCALFVVGLIIKRQFFSRHRRPQKRYIANWQNLSFTGQRSGPAHAPVQIVEFFDYQCPFCRQAQPAVKQIRHEYPQKVAVIHEDDPLPMHQHAFGAAVAAECARRQHNFMAYHDSLFARQKKLGPERYYERLAVQINISDTSAFRQCLDQQKTAATVQAGKKMAKRLNVSGIPAFLINGTLVTGVLPKRQLEQYVKHALAKAGR